MTNRRSWAYSGIFFVAGSIILFEIAMTRVFAIMMWHHFTYMVISIALLGFGAAGSILTATRASLSTGSPAKPLAACATAYGIASILSFFVTTRIHIDSLEIWHDVSSFLTLLLIYVVLAVPLLLGGLTVGLALARLVDEVNRLYCADLLGSAAGAAASVWLLARWGSTAAIMSAGAIGLFGAFLFSLGAGRRSRILPAASCAAAVLLAIGFSGGALDWSIPYAPGKEFASAHSLGLRPEVRLPSATAEVAVSQDYHHEPGIGGDFGKKDSGKVDLRVVAQDGTAPTMLLKNAADIDSFKFLDDTQAASAYVCRRACGLTDPDVLVIGVGGGVDVMIGLAHGAKHVTGVEINPAMIRMATETFAGYSGGLLVPGAHAYSDRIALVEGEGRSYVRRRPDRFDVIQMSGVDTFTALSTGAYTLSESYLYTVEAVKEFYEHLNEGGYVSYSRFILTYPKAPRETLRLANIAVTALEELGVPDAASSVCVFQGSNWASTMIKRGRFTPEEMRALDRFAIDEGFLGLVFDPVFDATKPFPPSIGAFQTGLSGLREFVTKEILPAGATADAAQLDAVVFPLWDMICAKAVGDQAAFDGAQEALLALLPETDRARASATLAGAMGPSVKFALEATGHFNDVRRDFAQVLRGDLAERKRFVDAYAYDVSPCRDDRPFFFNYYKYSGLVRGGARAGQHWYHADFPIGHMVLVASLAQILLLAVVLIVGPIRRLARHGLRTEGKLRYLAYFGALGLGFMSIEIVMMQKMVLFLGHPTYSLSVVLTALLAATGLGSFLSSRLPLRRSTFLGVLAAILVTTLGALLVANHVLPLALGRPLAERIGWVILVLAPLGVALGMAFPTGIRLVRERAQPLVPWCWAINGITSVFATIFCIMVALEFGFSAVMLIAAGIYVAGMLAILGIAEAARPDAVGEAARVAQVTGPGRS